MGVYSVEKHLAQIEGASKAQAFSLRSQGVTSVKSMTEPMMAGFNFVDLEHCLPEDREAREGAEAHLRDWDAAMKGDPNASDRKKFEDLDRRFVIAASSLYRCVMMWGGDLNDAQNDPIANQAISKANGAINKILPDAYTYLRGDPENPATYRAIFNDVHSRLTFQRLEILNEAGVELRSR